jgi:hypothetical protein
VPFGASLGVAAVGFLIARSASLIDTSGDRGPGGFDIAATPGVNGVEGASLGSATTLRRSAFPPNGRGSRWRGAHVPEMVDWVVDHVPGNRVDGEGRAVRPTTSPIPLGSSYLIQPHGHVLRSGDEFGYHLTRILLLIAVLDRGSVLIPVGIEGIVLGQHQGDASVVPPEHVPYVTCVLQ